MFCSYRRDGAPAGRMAAAIRVSRPVRPKACPLWLRFVHRRVREAIGVGVQRAADVLEGDAADLVREQARLGVQRLQPGCFTL